MSIINCQLSISLCALNPTEIVTLANLGTLFGSDLDKFATKGSGNRNNLAPWSLNVAEGIAFLVLLTDERFDTRFAGALADRLVWPGGEVS